MQRELSCYSNDLHEALLEKAATDFWKCWRSKFEDKNATTCNVNGLADESSIAAKFAEHFANVSRGNSEANCSKLKEEYTDVRQTYIGETYLVDYYFDVELVDKIISSLKKGKTAGLDGLTAEHLQFCHPVLPLILVKNCLTFNVLCLRSCVLWSTLYCANTQRR